MDETNIIIERPPAAQALIDKARSLEAERDRYKRERDQLLQFLSEWTYSGHLQTFEDLEKFRKFATFLVSTIKD